MKQLAVISKELYKELVIENPNLIAQIDIDGSIILLGIIKNYNISQKVEEDSVLVKKLGFSLNFRDKSVIQTAWSLLQKRSKGMKFLPIGSDFVGKIIEKSKTVNNVKVGDLVIPNCTYNKFSKGIPTNCSSKEYQYFKESELLVMDSSISIEKASVMGIGLFTSYSMIRKANIKPKDKILITSITSNTSQFILNLLRSLYSNEIYAISFTGSIKQKDGVTKIFSKDDVLTGLPMDFDVVFDSFADTYLDDLMGCLNFGARYVSCGFYYQTENFKQIGLQKLIYSIMSKNITLIGNCLGEEEDLYSALELVKKGYVDIPIDSIYTSGMPLQDFIDKSFSIKPRMGKVAYLY